MAISQHVTSVLFTSHPQDGLVVNFYIPHNRRMPFQAEEALGPISIPRGSHGVAVAYILVHPVHINKKCILFLSSFYGLCTRLLLTFWYINHKKMKGKECIYVTMLFNFIFFIWTGCNIVIYQLCTYIFCWWYGLGVILLFISYVRTSFVVDMDWV